MAEGPFNDAAVAAPPSPSCPVDEPPATVGIVPVPTAILLMRLLEASAMKRLPLPSNATLLGKRRLADVAVIPSPLKPRNPLPTSVQHPPVNLTRITLNAFVFPIIRVSSTVLGGIILIAIAIAEGAFKPDM